MKLLNCLASLAMVLFPFSYDITVSQNVVSDSVESAGFAIASEIGGSLTNVRLEKNIAYRNHTYGIEISHCCSASHPMDTIVIINNTLYGNGMGWDGGIIADNWRNSFPPALPAPGGEVTILSQSTEDRTPQSQKRG